MFLCSTANKSDPRAKKKVCFKINLIKHIICSYLSYLFFLMMVPGYNLVTYPNSIVHATLFSLSRPPAVDQRTRYPALLAQLYTIPRMYREFFISIRMF